MTEKTNHALQTLLFESFEFLSFDIVGAQASLRAVFRISAKVAPGGLRTSHFVPIFGFIAAFYKRQSQSPLTWHRGPGFSR